MKVPSGKVWLQFAAVLFLLNSFSAYGACCFAPAEDDAAPQPPCHQMDRGAGEQDPQGDEHAAGECCLMCLPALQHPEPIQPGLHLPPVPATAPARPLMLAAPETLFRPPIAHLS